MKFYCVINTYLELKISDSKLLENLDFRWNKWPTGCTAECV